MSRGVALEMWGGVECTVTRVRDSFRNQLAMSGHDRRLSDLDLFAGLGLERIRYPVLWELVAPDHPDECAWSWPDERLRRLRELNLPPIVGLLHHGTGPRYTNLLDPDFPTLFGRYARRVAERYPWVDHYTPVNEPLTTARFACLYGHWHPHARSEAEFLQALMNEIKAAVLAMQAIRSVNPRAQLVATDDLGWTCASKSLQYQADYENERRWLGWDLLSGLVDTHHPWHASLRAAGVSGSDLDWLRDNACVPDVIGINHYVTSDRMLHEDWQRFPENTWGGNGRHRYADTEAVRVLDDYVPGFERTLICAWERYQRPVALTEVHLGGDVDACARWLNQAWTAAKSVQRAGVCVTAITSWALLGSYDWNTLLTREEGCYEAGAFDAKDGIPRPTRVARCIQHLAQFAEHHPDPVPAGWWEDRSRITVPLEANA